MSSDRQATRGTSLEGQREAHLSYCAAYGLPEPIFYVEVESAGDLAIEKRDQQLRIQRDLEPGELLLVTVLDRWSRDVPHAVSTIRALIKRQVGAILFQDSIDASTAEGDWMLVQRSAMAEQERKRLIERTVVRRRQLADAGFYVAGPAPFGYRLERRRLVVVPDDAAIVRDIFNRCADGESLADIAATLPPTRKRSTWTTYAVHRVLRNRSALGEVKRSDGTWAEVHEAIVSRDLWERAHEAMRKRVAGGRKYSQGESARRLLRGRAICAGCGAHVSVRFGAHHQPREEQENRVHYYVCRAVLRGECEQGWNRAYAIDADAAEQVLERLADLRTELAKPPAAPATPKPTRDFRGMLARVDTQRKNAVDLATSGVMSAADLQAALARYDEQAHGIRRDMERAAEEEAKAAKVEDPETRRRLLGEVKHIRFAWGNLSVEQRQAILALLAARVEVGRIGVRITWRSAAELAGAWTEKRRVT